MYNERTDKGGIFMKTFEKPLRYRAAAVLAVLLLLSSIPLSVLCTTGLYLFAEATDDRKALRYYAEVLAEYQTAIRNDFYREGNRFKNGLRYVGAACLEQKYCNPTSNDLYYALFDINQNGFPELIVGEPGKKQTDTWELYGVYTYTDTVKVVDKNAAFWGYRTHATIHKNGTIAVRSHEGAYDTAWVFFKLNKDDQPKRKDALRRCTYQTEAYYRLKGDDRSDADKALSEKAFRRSIKSLTGQSKADRLKTDVDLQWKDLRSLPTVSTLAKPEHLRTRDVTPTALTLCWKGVRGAKRYEIRRYDDVQKKYVTVAQTKKTSLRLTDLAPDAAARFAVRACSRPLKKVLYGKTAKLTVRTPV